MSPDDLERKLTERPFQPFRIKLATNSTIDVQSPGEIVLGTTSAIFPLDVVRDVEGFRLVKTWRTISIAPMVEFLDIEPGKRGSRGKRAP